MITPDVLVPLAVLVPLVGAGLVVYTGFAPNLREAVSLLTAILLFGIVASLFPEVMAGGRPGMTLLEMLPGLGLAFRVEPLGLLFALIASFLWIVTTIYAIGYMRGHHEENQTRFYAFFALSLGAAVGVAFAGNLLTLFVFYEALTLSTFPLVAHHGDEKAKDGARTYLGILIGTSIAFFLLAVIWTWTVAGTLDFTPGGILQGKMAGPALGLLLGLYVFGIGKAAVMPFHRWLPSAMVAPTPVSALLHAVAVVKAGVFSVVKVVLYIFGLDFLAAEGNTQPLQYVAGATILIASLIALSKDNLKARLAYSTISQLSYVVLGALVLAPLSVLGAAFHIAAHAFGKITLFFAAGSILVASHKTNVSQLDGIGRRMPWTMGAFAVGALSMIGLPPTAGFVSKWFLLDGGLQSGNMLVVAVLSLSTLLNAGYYLPILYAAFFKPETAHTADTGHGIVADHGESPLPSVLALVVTATGTVVLFFASDRVLALAQRLTGG